MPTVLENRAAECDQLRQATGMGGEANNSATANTATDGGNVALSAPAGDTGGKLAPLADILLNVPSTHTPVIQQGHLCLYHHLCEIVEKRLAAA